MAICIFTTDWCPFKFERGKALFRELRDKNCTNRFGFFASSKKKKKKTKFRPLEDFETESSAEVNMNNCESYPYTKVSDPYGFDDEGEGGDRDDDDPLSEEMLDMYVQLEQEMGSAGAPGGATVVHRPRLGGSCHRPGRTSSLFTSLRQQAEERASRPRAPWQPGKRHCSRCGSEDHIIYSCPLHNEANVL